MLASGEKAVVLLSGGLDSATCLAIASRSGYELYALSVRYGQRHAVELKAAERLARAYDVARHMVIDLDLRLIGGSALTADIGVPKNRDETAMADGIPATYVPARNTIFLSLALAWAETLDCRNIFIGVNALDFSGYPDCRPSFIAAFERLAAEATAMGGRAGAALRIHTPLIDCSKADIVRKGQSLGLDFALTHSCYDPDSSGRPCGTCDACVLRRKGFREAGILDPLEEQDGG